LVGSAGMSTIDKRDTEGSKVKAASLSGRETQIGNNLSEGKPDIVKSDVETPSMSHELANADYDEKGAAQSNYGKAEARDIGWQSHPADVPSPLVAGLSNEELWTLIRRFNKVRD
jgi:hypothetical protein